jgi:hypothetical protein
MYYDFTAGDKEYKLRLSTRAIVALEKSIGCNPLMIFGRAGEIVPTITTMVAVLHASLQQMNHGISLNDAYDIFDAWIADGNNPTEFIKVIMGIYDMSGLLPKDAGNSEKN